MKIAIHTHIFYVGIWNEIKEYLKNIECEYELYITLVEDNKKLKEDVLLFNKDTKIYLVDNIGFDIAPFIFFLNKINLDDYDFIIKIHTKGDSSNNTLINGSQLKGNTWRNRLLSIINPKENFEKCMSAFKENKKLGMVADFRLIVKKDIHDKTANNLAFKFMNFKNFTIAKNAKFVAGTMFITRAKLMQPIKDLNIPLSTFATSSSSIKGATFVHAFERVLGYIIYSQGYYIDDPMHSNAEKQLFKLYSCINSIKRFIFQNKTTQGGNKIIKIFKIPIFHKKSKK